MMEKQNRTIEKGAAGDSGVLDDLVDFATGKLQKTHATEPGRRHPDTRVRGIPMPEDPAVQIG